MYTKTVYSKTTKGIQAINQKGKRLPANLLRVLNLVDGKSTVKEISTKEDIFLTALNQALSDLARDGYVRALDSGHHEEDSSVPGLGAVSSLVAETVDEAFFFKELAKVEGRKATEVPSGEQGQKTAPPKEAKVSAQVEKQTHVESQKRTAPVPSLPVESRVDAPRQAVEKRSEASGQEDYQEANSKVILERKAREEAEEKARALERANRRLEARAREEAEARARAEAEAKARAEAEARANAEAKERARREAEEAARAEKAARARAEAAARAREEAERKARQEAETRAREKTVANAIAEAEERARREAEETAKAEKAAKAKALAEAKQKEREEAKEEQRKREEIAAKAKVLAEIRALEEEKARLKADLKPRRIRKPVKWGQMALIFLAVLIVLPLMLLQAVSLNSFIPSVVSIAEGKLHKPVSISSMRASLWPTPHLRLEGVTIGNDRDVKIATIRAMPELGTLLEDTKIFKTIEVDSLRLDQDTLPGIIGWTGLGDNSGNVQIRRISLKNTTLDVKDIALPPLNGEIALTATGFDKARIVSVDNKIEVEVTPSNGEFDVSFAAKDWQPPLGPQVIFEDLAAKGTATRDGMRISEIQGRLFEGAIKGAAMVKWGEFWTAEGNFNVSRIALDMAMPALTGDVPLSGRVDADATYSMKAGSLAKLFDAPHIKASFYSRNGSIANIDLGRAVQARTPEAIKGGRTAFTGLSGDMTLTDNRYQFRKLELSSGQLNARGEADITQGRELLGQFNAEMKFKSNVIRSRLVLSGSPKQPGLRREGF